MKNNGEITFGKSQMNVFERLWERLKSFLIHAFGWDLGPYDGTS